MIPHWNGNEPAAGSFRGEGKSCACAFFLSSCTCNFFQGFFFPHGRKAGEKHNSMEKKKTHAQHNGRLGETKKEKPMTTKKKPLER